MSFWYRAEVRHYSVSDEWGDHSHTSTEIYWTKYAVVKATPKGVWLRSVSWGETNTEKYQDGRSRDFHMEPQFVLGTARRQLACPTKELALEDCRQRKLAHVRGCEARLRGAQADLRLIETYDGRRL